MKKLILFVIALSSVFLILNLVDRITESNTKSDMLWQQASDKNTIVSYQNYLSQDKQYQQQANAKIVAIKQDKLRFKSVVEAGTLASVVQYLTECEKRLCVYQASAENILESTKNLTRQFNNNLNNNNLSYGANGYALLNIEQLQQLLPNDSRLQQWSLQLSKKLQAIAKSHIEKKQFKKVDNYLALINRLNKTYAVNKNDKNSANIIKEVIAQNINLIRNSPDRLVNYFKECGSNCPRNTSVLQENIKKYQKLKVSFKRKIKKQRLSRAIEDLNALEKLFKGSEQARLWRKEIADGFFELAQKYNGQKSLQYIKKGLSVDTGHLELKELQKVAGRKEKKRLKKIADLEKLERLKQKAREMFKKEKTETYEKAINKQTIQALRHYVDHCFGECPEIEAAQDKIIQAEIIIDDFLDHIKDGQLFQGNLGYAFLDLESLKKLFKKDPLVRKWEKTILKETVANIKNSIKNKRYLYAKKQLKKAMQVYKKDGGLFKLNQKIKQQNSGKNAYLVPSLAYIKGGGFTMGGKLRYAKPKRWVRLKPFKISKTEVTFNQYRRYARSKRTKLQSSGWGKGMRPVVNISWNQANGYTQWLSKQTKRKFRLPTEAEWEFVARNSPLILSATRMNKSKACRYANGADLTSGLPWKNRQCRDKFGDKTAPVKSYLPNRFGVYDMHGNVWEWTSDCWHNSFKGAPTDNKIWNYGGNCTRRVIKGGGWNSSTYAMLPGYRNSAIKKLEYNYIGFRIVEQL